MHELVEGSRLKISSPKDRFPLVSEAGQYILIAGGIGITPLTSMLKHLRARGARVELHYFTRSPQATAFREFLARNHPQDAKLYCGYDPKQVAVTLAAVLAAPGQDAHAYICGPAPLMECSFTLTQELGWPPAHVHSEFFGAQPAQATSPEAFRVCLRSTGDTFAVAAGQTMLEALRQRGVHIDSSCEQGICGTCMVRVLQGTLVHHDSYLTDEEKQSGDVVLPCISRGIGTVVLDI